MLTSNKLLNLARSHRFRRRLRAGSALPGRLQNEVVRAYRRLSSPSLVSPIELFGFRIFFLGERQLRFLSNEIFFEASYFFKADTDTPRIVDCGSNIGMSILFFKALYPRAHIIAFEPDPLTFETLERNVRENCLSDVELHQVALSDHDGSIEFFRDSVNEGSLTMSILRERESGPSVTVPSRRLSGFLSSEVDLVKIDVEGAEDSILSDLVSTGKLRFIKSLHLEYHHHIDGRVDKLSSMLRLLETSGFGYQLRANPNKTWPTEGSFQDIGLYCYRQN